MPIEQSGSTTSVRDSTWFEIEQTASIDSPALLIYADRVDRNIDRALQIAGDARRLRPHVKTHKLGPIIERHVARGITRFKCATVAEAEMVATAGGADVLLAMQPVGGKVERLLELVRCFPAVRFSTLIDDASAASALSAACVRAGHDLETWLDIDCGMGRTGIAPQHALALAHHVAQLPKLRVAGLHAYDGHIHDLDPQQRAARCHTAFLPVRALWRSLQSAGFADAQLVAGGTSTFPMHAAAGDVECSPGTYVLWDSGYSHELPDLDFLHAATLLCRVISKPAANRLCLDLGHKAVASEMPHPRVTFPQFPDATPVMHSEEHLVIETPGAAAVAVGSAVYAIPWHICPTTALHAEVVVIENAHATQRWPVLARARKITV
jgi:D-serine deaminase-like pyridoxal phosphate-dependent protein